MYTRVRTHARTCTSYRAHSTQAKEVARLNRQIQGLETLLKSVGEERDRLYLQATEQVCA